MDNKNSIELNLYEINLINNKKFALEYLKLRKIKFNVGTFIRITKVEKKTSRGHTHAHKA